MVDLRGELVEAIVSWRRALWLGDHRSELNHAGLAREFGRAPQS
jgi:hypothetical protein